MVWLHWPACCFFFFSFLVSAEMCLLSNNIRDYYFVSQGKTTIPGLDDGEELIVTDVSACIHVWWSLYFYFVFFWEIQNKSSTNVERNQHCSPFLCFQVLFLYFISVVCLNNVAANSFFILSLYVSIFLSLFYSFYFFHNFTRRKIYTFC